VLPNQQVKAHKHYKQQVGSFNLHVRRSKSAFKAAAAAAAPAPVAAAAPAPVVIASVDASIEESVDESLVYVQSPKVGIFRRGKFVGGKRVGKEPVVKEGDQVKKGQALGFVEQLGSHFPVEAPQAGEVAKFLLEDGAAVSFQEVCVEIAPFFGGHIIGDAKLV
jgi:biotin carboxyl carrier protein